MSSILLNETGSTPSSPSAGKRKLYVNGSGALALLDSAGNVSAVGSADTRGYDFLVGPNDEDPYSDIDSAIAAADAAGQNVVFIKASATPYAAPSDPIPDGFRIVGLGGTANEIFSTEVGASVVIEGEVTISAGTEVTFKNVTLKTADNTSGALVVENNATVRCIGCVVINDDTSSVVSSNLISMGAGAGFCALYFEDCSLICSRLGQTSSGTLFDVSGNTLVVQAYRTTLISDEIFSGPNAGSVGMFDCYISTPSQGPTPFFGVYRNCTLSIDAVTVASLTMEGCRFGEISYDDDVVISLKNCYGEDIHFNATNGADFNAYECTIDGISRSAVCAINLHNCTVRVSFDLSVGGPISVIGCSIMVDVEVREPDSGSGSLFMNSTVQGDITFSGTGGSHFAVVANVTAVGGINLNYAGDYIIEGCALQGDLNLGAAAINGYVHRTVGSNLTNSAGSLTGSFEVRSPENFGSIASTISAGNLLYQTSSAGVLSMVPASKGGLCDTSVAVQITLPDGANCYVGKQFTFIDTSGRASTGNITFVGVTAPVNASTVSTDYAVFYATWDGTHWIQS